MFEIRIQKEKTETEITSSSRLVAYPIPSKEMANTTKEINKGLRLLNFDTSHPDIGSPINELIGMTSNKFPNSASLKSKLDLIDGIRDAQDAKQNPSKKKNMLSANRCFEPEFMTQIYLGKYLTYFTVFNKWSQQSLSKSLTKDQNRNAFMV